MRTVRFARIAYVAWRFGLDEIIASGAQATLGKRWMFGLAGWPEDAGGTEVGVGHRVGSRSGSGSPDRSSEPAPSPVTVPNARPASNPCPGTG